MATLSPGTLLARRFRLVARERSAAEPSAASSCAEQWLAVDVATRTAVSVLVARKGGPAEDDVIRAGSVLRCVRGGVGMARLLHCAEDASGVRVVAAERLGVTLADVLLKRCDGRFSAATALQVVIQLVDRLECLHECGFLYRRVGTRGACIGAGHAASTVFLSDLSGVSRYRDKRTHAHRPYLEAVRSDRGIGDPRFASLGALLRIRCSRRDDVESLAYLLVFLLRGGWLPWVGGPDDSAEACTTRAIEGKARIPPKELCAGLPGAEHCSAYLAYCRRLRYEEAPDYDHIRDLLRKVAAAVGPEALLEPLDWLRPPPVPVGTDSPVAAAPAAVVAAHSDGDVGNAGAGGGAATATRRGGAGGGAVPAAAAAAGLAVGVLSSSGEEEEGGVGAG